MARAWLPAKNSVISAARKIAFETLRRVEAEGAYATDVLHVELGGAISSADAALATELTLGVLRWRGLLDFLLERLLQKPSRASISPSRSPSAWGFTSFASCNAFPHAPP